MQGGNLGRHRLVEIGCAKYESKFPAAVIDVQLPFTAERTGGLP